MSRETLTAIGIEHARIPAPSVWCELFQDLDIVALEQALGAWVQGGSAPGHVAIGVTITGDAIFTQKAICQVIIDGGEDYFFTVKGNQPALTSDIEQAFRPLSPFGGMIATA